MQGLRQLMAQLPYGWGLRLMECLRVKDMDFEQAQRATASGQSVSIPCPDQ